MDKNKVKSLSAIAKLAVILEKIMKEEKIEDLEALEFYKKVVQSRIHLKDKRSFSEKVLKGYEILLKQLSL